MYIYVYVPVCAREKRGKEKGCVPLHFPAALSKLPAVERGLWAASTGHYSG